MHGDRVRLFSRRGNDFTKRFAPVAAAVAKLKVLSATLDGEVVAVDEIGKPFVPSPTKSGEAAAGL